MLIKSNTLSKAMLIKYVIFSKCIGDEMLSISRYASLQQCFLLTAQQFLLVKYSGPDLPSHYLTVTPEEKTARKDRTKIDLWIKLLLNWFAPKQRPHKCLISLNSYSLTTIISSGRILPMTTITTSAQAAEGWKTPTAPLVIKFCCAAGTSAITGILDDKKQTCFTLSTSIYLFSCQNYVSLSNDSTWFLYLEYNI